MPLKKPAYPLLLSVLFTSIVSCSVTSDSQITSLIPQSSLPIESGELVISTWNVEHLASPITDGCRPRSEEELRRLQEYAQSLDADIVALQEVASIEAAELLFPKQGWQIVISTRPDSEPYTCRKSGFTSTQQKVAFAVRNGIKIIRANSLGSLGLENPGLRYGLELTVDSPLGAMTLLNVHMKSGCFVDNYSRSDSEACQTFAAQAPILDAWAEQKEQDGTPYVMLGDFNHRLSAPYNHLTRQLTSNSNGSISTIENPGAHLIGCHPYYPAPIDHILIGNMSKKGLNKSTNIHPFADMKPDAMLSDHCALSLHLSDISYPLSNAVKWQTTSKEYRYLTSAAYQSATDALNNLDLPSSPWAVVMDVDETVLDNSQYQVSVEQIGASYDPETWNAWVASERATLVPGVKEFIQTVFQLGGKLALVTNRNRELDQHTWRNLQSLEVPISNANTCLIGRVDADKKAISGDSVINDKDLRRQQLENGNASCYQAGKKRTSLFPELKIIMQVGDNIEDFAGVTQEEANIEELLPKSKAELILLPNPMYGSW